MTLNPKAHEPIAIALNPITLNPKAFLEDVPDVGIGLLKMVPRAGTKGDGHEPQFLGD